MNKFKKVYDTTEVKKKIHFCKEMMQEAKNQIDFKHWASEYIAACNDFEHRIRAKKLIEDSI